MNKRITIQITTNNRITELYGLLQALRTQSYQDFDVMILDDGSGQLIFQHESIQKIVQLMKLEKHCFKLIRNDYRTGVTKARNKLIEEDIFDNLLICRIDDDSIIQSDYLEKLVSVIDAGYDLAGGTVPTLWSPRICRRTKFVKPIINELKFDNEGNLTQLGDDCGMDYWEDEIIPTHHLRSSFMYKKEITDKGLRYEKGITGFREETFFCVRAMLMGYTLAVHTGAEALHAMTGSGGCRPDYGVFAQDDITFKKWIKRKWEENPGFLEKYNEKVLK